ncbi:MAG: biopolymer transporter ExbD [Isosphaeraceae bacterium]
MPLRSRRKNQGDVLNPNLTPLLDVVLQLITFFMMLIHFGTKIEGATRAVRLPVTPAALPGADLTLDRLTVSLDARGRLLVGGDSRGENMKTLEGGEAESWWAEQAAARRGGLETLGGPADQLPTVVVVRADREASYGSVRRTLSAAQNRGFAHFSLVVLRREDR